MAVIQKTDDLKARALKVVAKDHRSTFEELWAEGWFSVSNVRKRINHVYPAIRWSRKTGVRKSIQQKFEQHYPLHAEASEDDFLYQADVIVFSDYFWSAVDASAEHVLQGITTVLEALRKYYADPENLDDLAIWLNYLLPFARERWEMVPLTDLDAGPANKDPRTGDILRCDDGSPLPENLDEWVNRSDRAHEAGNKEEYVPPCFSLEEWQDIGQPYINRFKSLLASFSRDYEELKNKAVAVHPLIAFVLENDTVDLWNETKRSLSAIEDVEARREGLKAIVTRALDYMENGRTSFEKTVRTLPEDQDWKHYEPLINKVIDETIRPGEKAGLGGFLEDVVKRQRIRKSVGEILFDIAFVVGMVGIGLLGAGLGASIAAVVVSAAEAALTVTSSILGFAERKQFEEVSRLELVSDIRDSVAIDTRSPEEALLWGILSIVAILGVAKYASKAVRRAKIKVKQGSKARRKEKPSVGEPRHTRGTTRRGNENRTPQSRSLDVPETAAPSRGTLGSGTTEDSILRPEQRALRQKLVAEIEAEEAAGLNAIKAQIEDAKASLEAAKRRASTLNNEKRAIAKKHGKDDPAFAQKDFEHKTATEERKRIQERISKLVAEKSEITLHTDVRARGLYLEKEILRDLSGEGIRAGFAAIDDVKRSGARLRVFQIKSWEPDEKILARWESGATNAEVVNDILNKPVKNVIRKLNAHWDKATREWNVTQRQVNAERVGFELPRRWNDPSMTIDVRIRIIGNRPPNWEVIYRDLSRRVKTEYSGNIILDLDFDIPVSIYAY